MRVPVSWLRSYCDPGMSAEEIAERLTAGGLELDTLHRTGVGDPAAFVVGKVLEAEPHPDADRLRVCRVDDGSAEPRTIVCGAPNVAAGQTVAVARPGAVLPDGSSLGEAELRGVRSSGMILAEDELGIGENHAGIIVLDNGAAAGTPLADALPIADEVIELEVNPNRPDALGVFGVARDLHAVTGADLAPDPTSADAEPGGSGSAEDHASVEIADPEICLRFTARAFEDVTIEDSPLWLKQRLMAAGQRPISNVVDITNYVMLTCGQPLHAFDLEKVRGRRIVVRKAQEDETMRTLDGVERRFSAGAALVCDAEGPVGIAGIMGGELAEVSDETTRVLMEVATWVGPNILKTSKELALRTEASTRFEKQLHPEMAMAGQRLASRLMVELCGARLVPGTIDAYPRPLRKRELTLRLERLTGLLGEEIPPDEVVATLGRLGFEPDLRDGVVAVAVPPWRDSDVQREVDLVEEVARIHGLDRLSATLPARSRAVGRLTDHQRLRRRLENALRDRGMSECVSYSFTSPEAIERLGLEAELRIANPLSEDASAMRPLLLVGLLDAAAHNAAHGRADVALFESAHVYLARGPLEDGGDRSTTSPLGEQPADEPHHIGGLLVGSMPGGWRTPARTVDLYTARSLVEAILTSAGIAWRARAVPRRWLHPGRAATVVSAEGGVEVGWFGELHPLVARHWEIEGATAAFELDVDALARLQGGPASFTDLTSYPAVLEDIAVVVPEEVSAAQVDDAVREGGGELLAATRVFDLYRGEQVGEGHKSVALRLEFRAPDRTLTDAEVAERRTGIEAAVQRIGGRLRRG